MKTETGKIRVNLGERSYDVLIGYHLFADPALTQSLAPVLTGKNVILVTDSHTDSLYGDSVSRSLAEAGAVQIVRHILPAGEEYKTFQTVEGICRKAAQSGLDRSSVFFGLGGGVVTDLTGFAASIFMRGTAFISCPSSLLAMIDAGIGGKTGADLPEGKNLIGSFWQPKIVLADTAFLESLPPDQLRCGCAELIKHAILFDPPLFRALEEKPDLFFTLSDPEEIVRIITKSCAWKAEVVSGDERESGRRALLNFGHSFGHAIEKLFHFQMGHGDAVAIGIAMASDLAAAEGLLTQTDSARIQALLQAYRLPVRVKGLTPGSIREAMRGDKKNTGGHTRLILPHWIGDCRIHTDTPEEAILRAIEVHCD